MFSSILLLQKLKLILPTEFCDGAFQSSLTDSLADLATILDIATDVLSQFNTSLATTFHQAY